jgi:hypothetical protein
LKAENLLKIIFLGLKLGFNEILETGCSKTDQFPAKPNRIVANPLIAAKKKPRMLSSTALAN